VNYYPSSAHVKEERDGEERDGEGGLWRDLNQIVSLRIQVYEGLTPTPLFQVEAKPLAYHLSSSL